LESNEEHDGERAGAALVKSSATAQANFSK
jgi:hypothetical protein